MQIWTDETTWIDPDNSEWGWIDARRPEPLTVQHHGGLMDSLDEIVDLIDRKLAEIQQAIADLKQQEEALDKVRSVLAAKPVADLLNTQ